MLQYVKIQNRFDRLEQIDEIAHELENISLDYMIDTSREYPRGYTGSTDGYVILSFENAFVFSDDIKRMLVDMLQDDLSEIDYPYKTKVELIVDPTPEATKLIFHIPDIWVKMDVPSYSEALANGENPKVYN